MNEKLSLDLISRAHEKFENIKIIEVAIEVDEELKIVELEMYKFFSPTLIEECVHEFINNIDKARKVDVDGFGDVTEPYLMWLLIKHFTKLGGIMPTKFEDQMKSLREMIDTSTLFQIMSNFDEEQVRLVKESLEVTIATFESNEGFVNELKKKMERELEDKSLLE